MQSTVIDQAAVLLTEKDLASILNVSLPTIRRWRMLKQGPAFLKFPGAVRYRRSTVDEFVSGVEREWTGR